jgi:predicted GNAT family N-acyltransferase
MIKVVNVSTTDELKECLLIRKKVFIESQGISEEEEVDGRDNESNHFLSLLNNLPVGTARVRFIQRKAKVERVAVLNEYQGRGLGKILMQYIIDKIKKSKKADIIFLSSQKTAVRFYQSLGFNIISGEEYIDAGIVHQDMRLVI